MANTNCLKDIRCLECGQEENFLITGVAVFDVTDDGSEVVGDHEWDEKSSIYCPKCRTRGCVSQFTFEDEQQKSMELNAILAGLRLLQRTKVLPDGIHDVLMGEGEDKGDYLDDAAIDELCERLNCGGYK